MTAIPPGFLQAILADPSDDTPRLILADWLEENGDAERGEFIRIQCELWSYIGDYPDGESADRVQILVNREKKLLRGPRPELFLPEVVWFNEGDGTDTWKFLFRPKWSRGFVSVVSCSAADWLAHGPAIVRAQPVERVTLSDHYLAQDRDNHLFLMIHRQGPYEYGELPFRQTQPCAIAEDARDALSDACLTWAKQNVRLRVEPQSITY